MSSCTICASLRLTHDLNHTCPAVAVRSILVWLTSLRNLVALQILVNNKSRGTPVAAVQLAFYFHAFRVTWKIIADKAFEYEHLTRALRHNRVVGGRINGASRKQAAVFSFAIL